MRALLIGDIHTEAEALATALALGVEHGVDRVLAVGDIVDGPGDPLAQLRASRSAPSSAGCSRRWWRARRRGRCRRDVGVMSAIASHDATLIA